MDSAFGIDHGDFSKAVFRRKEKPQERAFREQKQAKARATQAKLKAMPSRAANASISIADVGRGSSKGIAGVGNAIGRRPGLTGAALLGGGGLYAYKASRDHGQKQVKRQTGGM